MTPTRSRNLSRCTPSGRVVRSARAGWSPGEACRSGDAETCSVAFPPGAIRSRRGHKRSQPTSSRPGRTRGRPPSERANPARETSTLRARRPGFRTVMTVAAAPRSVTRRGLALSPMPPPAAAPEMDAAAVTMTTAVSSRLTGRSP
jgi:hypothetical protein